MSFIGAARTEGSFIKGTENMIVRLTLYVQGSDHCRQARSYVLDEMQVPVVYEESEHIKSVKLSDVVDGTSVYKMFKQDCEMAAIRRGIKQLEFKWRTLLDKLYNLSERTTEISCYYGNFGRNFFMMKGEVVSAVIELERTSIPSKSLGETPRKIGDIFGAMDAQELEKKIHMGIEWGIVR
jgi:hypothetical protein